MASPRGSSLASRLVSVSVLLPLMLLLVYLGVWSVLLVTITAIVICLFEFYRALRQAGYEPRFFTGTSIAVVFGLTAFLHHHGTFDFLGVVLSGSIILSFASELTRRDEQRSLENWSLSFTAAIYIGWLLSYYVLLRMLDTPLHQSWLSLLHIAPGAAWIYFVLAITWLQDAAAYFVGRAIGKHKMAPIISPGKTWEGALGGILAGAMAAMLAVFLLGLPIGYGTAFLLGIAGGSAGLLGDLAESLLKRRIGVKDMGNVMPGHGGILDRADSMLFTAPVLYYLILVVT